MVELQKGCISARDLNPYGPEHIFISLEDLKHQLFLNPEITAEELIEELNDNRAIDVWEVPEA